MSIINVSDRDSCAPFSPTGSALCYLWKNPSYFTSTMTAQERGRADRRDQAVAGVTNTDADWGKGNAEVQEYTWNSVATTEQSTKLVRFQLDNYSLLPPPQHVQTMLSLQQVPSPRGKSPFLIFSSTAKAKEHNPEQNTAVCFAGSRLTIIKRLQCELSTA